MKNLCFFAFFLQKETQEISNYFNKHLPQLGDNQDFFFLFPF